MSSLNAPTGPYGDNVVPINGLDSPRGEAAVELSGQPGVFAKVAVLGDPTTGLPANIPGARGANGPSTSYQDNVTEVSNPILLHSTSAVPVADGVIGAAGGTTNDTLLVAVCILKNAGPATLTVAGFMGEDGVPRSIVFQGSSTQDSILPLSGLGLRNSGGPMKLTASVADTCLVGVRPTGLVTPSMGVVPSAGGGAFAQQLGFNGQVVQLFPGTQRGPTVGSATLGGIAPVVTVVPAIAPSVVALAATGVAPGISKGIAGTAGAAALTGVAPRLYINAQTPLNNAALLTTYAPLVAQTTF